MRKDIESTEADLIIDTRDPMERAADALAGDRLDEVTGKIVRDEEEAARIVQEEADKDAADRIRGSDWIDPDTDLIEPTLPAPPPPPTPTSSETGTVYFPDSPAVGPPRVNDEDDEEGTT